MASAVCRQRHQLLSVATAMETQRPIGSSLRPCRLNNCPVTTPQHICVYGEGVRLSCKEKKEYKLLQLPYKDKAKIDHLAHLAEVNVSMNKDHILKEIKKAVQRRSVH